MNKANFLYYNYDYNDNPPEKKYDYNSMNMLFYAAITSLFICFTILCYKSLCIKLSSTIINSRNNSSINNIIEYSDTIIEISNNEIVVSDDINNTILNNYHICNYNYYIH